MKITKRLLRRIIKEEKAKVLAEQTGSKPGITRATVQRAIPQGEKIWSALSSLIDQALDQARSPDEYGQLADDLRGYADDVEDSVPDTPSDDFMDVEGFRSEMQRRSR